MPVEQGLLADDTALERLLEQFSHLACGLLGRGADGIVRTGRLAAGAGMEQQFGLLAHHHGRLRGQRQFCLGIEHAVADRFDGAADHARAVHMAARGQRNGLHFPLGRGGSLVDGAEEGMHLLDLAAGRHHLAAQRFHAAGGALGLFADGAHQLADLVARFAGAHGQLAHFAGHHGKAPPMLAGAGGLDGRVQCQQVGALGDLVDGVGDAVDAARFFLQGPHQGHGRMGVLARLADLLQALVGLGAPGQAGATHVGRHSGGPLGVGGDVFRVGRRMGRVPHDFLHRLQVMLDLLADGVDEVRRFGRAYHHLVYHGAAAGQQLFRRAGAASTQEGTERHAAGRRQRRRHLRRPRRPGQGARAQRQRGKHHHSTQYRHPLPQHRLRKHSRLPLSRYGVATGAGARFTPPPAGPFPACGRSCCARCPTRAPRRMYCRHARPACAG